MTPVRGCSTLRSWLQANKILLPVIAALLPLSNWAEPAKPSRPLPRPDQGTISPSGKFSPAPTNAPGELPPRTAAEAQAALRQTLKLTQTGSNTFKIGQVEFDKQTRTVTLPARVCIRTQIVEYALVAQTGKAYESLLTTEASPTDVHLAFLLLGASQVQLSGNLRQPIQIPATNAVRIEVTWETNGQPVTCALSQLITLSDKGPLSPGRTLNVDQWLYNGSIFDRWGFAAQREGSIIALIGDPSALLNNPGGDRDSDNLHQPNAGRLPPDGWPVHVVMKLPQRQLLPAAKLPPWASPVTPLSTNK